MAATLHFKTLGQGDPVIVLHGLFGMLDNLLSLGKKLEDEGFMAFLVDQRDHGRSPHTTAFDYRLLAEDLSSFMEENWIHEGILIGHSMGGKTCLEFLIQNSDIITKAIIIDIGIKKYEEGHLTVFDALLAIDIDKVENRNEVENTLMSKLNDYGTVQFLMKNLTRKKTGGFEWKVNLPLIYKEYSNILADIPVDEPIYTDILFIRGAKSDYILDEDIPIIKEKFPNASFVTIADAGHWVHVDKPNELFEQIISYIRA